MAVMILTAIERMVATTTTLKPEKCWRSRCKMEQHKLLAGADYTPNITENFKAVLGGYAGLGYLKR